MVSRCRTVPNPEAERGLHDRIRLISIRADHAVWPTATCETGNGQQIRGLVHESC
jgi:hypothetical protein